MEVNKYPMPKKYHAVLSYCTTTFCRVFFVSLLLGLWANQQLKAQIYSHNFGTTAINTHPYNVPAAICDAHLLNSSWSNATNLWTSTAGSSGEAIRLTTATNTILTLTFNVAANFQADITAFNFWRMRSNLGPQNWSMTINGIAVGTGTIGTTGASIGTTTVTNPITGLTGAVTIELSLTGSTGTGTFRLDDFTLEGSVTSSCSGAIVTSFSPMTGPQNTLVTINGSGFLAGTGTSSVKFNGIAATSFHVISDSVIQAYLPAGNTSGNISVTSNSCEGFSTGSFTQLASIANNTYSSDIYISEIYDAQAGDGGVIEIYNGTANPVNLSGYTIRRYGDVGGPTFYTINLTGIIPPGGIFLVGIGTGTTPCSITENQHYSTGFNSNDEFQLYNGSVLIDNVHAPVNVGYSVIRNPNAIAPKPAFNAADWNTSTTESCADIGVHHITVNTPPTVTSPTSASICENNSVTYTATLANPAGYSFQWKTVNASGTWINVVNAAPYSGANTNVLTINPVPASFDNNQYYCQLTSTANNVVSNAAQLEVLPIIVPDFPTTLTVCNGETAPTLNNTSPNGIIGSWNPSAVSNTVSGNYLFTPNAGQCASTITLTVTVNNRITPDFATTVTLCNGETAPTLQTVSPNGIAGIWNPTTISNTASGNYVFTPNAGQCSNPVTLNVIINNRITPNFVTALTFCQGETVPTLNPVSPNGIIGTWNPATISNTASSNYIFTPNVGECATSVTLIVTINNNVVPDFATSLTLCNGEAAPALAVISPNGITGTWNPTTINNTTSGNYVFTPNTGQCASNITLIVTVNNRITPDFATNLTLCNGEPAPTLQTVSPNGIAGTWNQTTISNTASGNYVFTPNAGQCSNPVTLNVIINNRITPNFVTALTFCQGESVPTLNPVSPNGITGTWTPATISNTASGNYIFTPNVGECATNVTLVVTINNNVVPDFSTSLILCQSQAAPLLNTISPNGISGIWSPNAINNMANGIYTFTPNSGQCANTIVLNVTVTTSIVPNFPTTLTFCSGDVVPALNAVSPNGISGIWNPSIISNTASGNYIFTPNPGQCAGSFTLSVTITNSVIPNFVTTLSVCSGAIVPVLQPISPNAISGNWNPATISNTASADYTFTPNPGQCSSAIVLRVTVNSRITPNFSTAIQLCRGDAAPILQSISPNGISGTWSPSVVNNNVSGNYAFTPNPSECANGITLTVTVRQKITPDFATGFVFCNGEAVPALSSTSPNGISGSWSPAVISNVNSGVYIFTPNANECANSVTLNVTINNRVVPNFPNTIQLCEGDTAPNLNLISPNGISGTWNPATLNNTVNGNYVFTPDSGQCATVATVIVTINPLPRPVLSDASICMDPKGQIVSPVRLDTGLSGADFSFNWSINSNPLSTTTAFHTATEPGLYQVLVTNLLTGCSSTAQANVSATPIAMAYAVTSPDFSGNPIITIIASGGSGLYEFQLDDFPAQQSNQFQNVSAGNHIVVFKDRNGCSEIPMNVFLLDYPHYFTPNSDGYNDYWNIRGLSQQRQSKIYIFDRYGKLLKSLKPSDESGWDGTFNGNALPSNDYWFQLFYEDRDGSVKEFKSHFSLKR